MKLKKIIIAVLLLGGLLAGASVVHYKGYDRKIVRKIRRKSKPAKKTKDYYSALFNDLNPKHLEAAKKVGLKQPLEGRAEVKKVKKKLVKIETNPYYKVDHLTHSVPYLTPGAADMLDMIGKNFSDSLKSRGLSPEYRIIVTSVLRTKEDVEKLRDSGNINASANSAHCYGTTIDITYVRFDKQTAKHNKGKNIDAGVLKGVLGEVLRDLRKQGKCYVKYEKQQACFHITSRM